MADIFVSYTASDRDWANWLGTELAAQGHTPHVHEWEIEKGGDIFAWMERRHDQADHVMCVVSDAYLKAPYSTLERNAALWQAVANRPGFALFVVVKPCRMPTLVDHIRRCELFGVSDEEARRRFRDFMGRRSAPTAALFPGQAYAVSNIPIRVPEHFMGRDDVLVSLDEAFERREGRIAIAVLHGLRGIGKTTLAAAYAERHRAAYRATWWIHAQTEATMRADLAGLGVRLKWVAVEEKEERALAIVAERLRHEGEGLLLIYDNAIDAASLRRYLPRAGGAQVLVTSNAHAWRGLGRPIEIRLWSREIGADYLVARTDSPEERGDAEVLSAALGGLPLAHEQAAAYCERLDVSLAAYLQRFAASPARLLDADRDSPAEYHDGLTVAKTFALAIDEASRLHPAAEPLIVHAALLAPEPIPLYLFAEARDRLGEPLASALADDGLDEAVSALRAFALVGRERISDERDPAVSTECIHLHPLVRQVATDRYDGEARHEALGRLLGAVSAVYPTTTFNHPAGWPRARRLDALALAVIETVGHEAAAASLVDRLAGFRSGALGAYDQARALYERALAIRERTFGPDHMETAVSLNNLALSLAFAGDLAGARPLIERSLVVCETALGPTHPETAATLNNLASLLHEMGDEAGARPLQERALAIREQVLGPDHPGTAESMNNLAFILEAQSDLAGARRLLERALAIRERELGPDHPSTAKTLNNLASLLKAIGEFAGARDLYERSLAILERTLGPAHPNTAIGLNNLASLLKSMGDFASARPHSERALAILDDTLGAEHATTSFARRNLGSILLRLSDPAGALALAQAALANHETVLGIDHPWTRESALVTIEALDALGRADEADALRTRFPIG